MKRNLENVKKLIEAKIVYYRTLQDKANKKGNIEGKEMYKFYRWALEEILENISSNKEFNINWKFYDVEKKDYEE